MPSRQGQTDKIREQSTQYDTSIERSNGYLYTTWHRSYRSHRTQLCHDTVVVALCNSRHLASTPTTCIDYESFPGGGTRLHFEDLNNIASCCMRSDGCRPFHCTILPMDGGCDPMDGAERFRNTRGSVYKLYKVNQSRNCVQRCPERKWVTAASSCAVH